jgi:hypothetical protein
MNLTNKRTAPKGLKCRGSLMPANFLKPGAWTVCPFCKTPVVLEKPPLRTSHDPWAGSTKARIPVHHPAEPP